MPSVFAPTPEFQQYYSRKIEVWRAVGQRPCRDWSEVVDEKREIVAIRRA